jgi:hypothetical protein
LVNYKKQETRQWREKKKRKGRKSRNWALKWAVKGRDLVRADIANFWA